MKCAFITPLSLLSAADRRALPDRTFPRLCSIHYPCLVQAVVFSFVFPPLAERASTIPHTVATAVVYHPGDVGDSRSRAGEI